MKILKNLDVQPGDLILKVDPKKQLFIVLDVDYRSQMPYKLLSLDYSNKIYDFFGEFTAELIFQFKNSLNFDAKEN